MKLKENTNYIKEKQLLLRQIENKYISEEEGLSKIKELDIKISKNVSEAIKESEAEIIKNAVFIKEENLEDGNMKRKIAAELIEILRLANLSEKEINGVFRQGYKIMRS